MVESSSTPLSPSAISWQQVIELDAAMISEDHDRIVVALELLERSTTGQVKFQEMVGIVEQRKRHFETAKLENKSSNNAIGTSGEEHKRFIDIIQEFYRKEEAKIKKEREEILSRRKQPEKFFIAALNESNPNQANNLERLKNGGGGMHVGNRLFLLHLPTIDQVRLPRIAEDGSKAALRASLDEILIHEFQHGITDQQNKLNGKENPTRGCNEFTAVQTENALRIERGDQSLRYTYEDPIFELNDLKRKMPDIPKATFNSKEFRREISSVFQKVVERNLGCINFSPDRVVAEASQLLRSQGIEPLFEPPKSQTISEKVPTSVPYVATETKTISQPVGKPSKETRSH